MAIDKPVDVLCLAKGHEEHAVPMSLALSTEVLEGNRVQYTAFREDAEDVLKRHMMRNNIDDDIADIQHIIFAEIPDHGRRWKINYSKVKLIEYPE